MISEVGMGSGERPKIILMKISCFGGRVPKLTPCARSSPFQRWEICARSGAIPARCPIYTILLGQLQVKITEQANGVTTSPAFRFKHIARPDPGRTIRPRRRRGDALKRRISSLT